VITLTERRMRGKAFVVAWHEADTVEALKAAYQAERDGQVRTRLHGLWLLRAGRGLREVAAVVGVDYRTAQRWAAWYRRGGLAEVRGRKMGGHGQVPFLSPAQEEEVVAEIATGRFRQGEEIRAHIRERYGASYTIGGIYSLTDRLDCAPKVPRPTHAKADPAARAAFKRGGSNRRSARPA
jgi:transposase